ncbi:MAG: bifunctional glutamate N-acetyltransferase/amino-acid acetyltransferase ArgJ [Rhodopirellula sp.]|nr:bifunctional glutamate N-acetyltransferase/amino-acid acetyltransferase ArgJ [Rhodopirellula sp.]
MSELPPLPTGFQAAGLHCGIKKDPSVFDLCLFSSNRPASLAGVFTQNKVCGAPVKVSRERVPRGTARAVVINSGNSNACTGDRGIEDARWMTALTAKSLGCDAEDVVVCSTGVIGRFLPKDVLEAGIPAVAEQLDDSPQAFNNAARAMMTTDTFAKQTTRTVDVASTTVRFSAVAKGAAMIGPNMATMLSVVMTDAALSPQEADAMLRHSVNHSFNCISVEGHTSTSDTVFLFANGAAGHAALDDSSRAALQAAIDEVTMEMAQAIIRDAEGADHFITIDVCGARTRDEAHCIAKAIADGPLVKTAITGADPNWGRIVSAAGYSGVELEEEDVSLWLNDVLIYKDGAPSSFDTKALSQSIRDNRDVSIRLQLTHGDAEVRFWTSDLTAEYVRLNSDYTT